DTDDQKSLTFKERSENLKDAFRLVNRDLIKDKSVLLVDDILTTCATVNTCAEYLSKHSTVYVTAIARNIPE
ncbi:MAG TPA: ComF family protein, partial [Candidatus Caccovivens faecavium]|nr:ComF family protein [Candidatus Caccovivens faecavium]